jgi:MoxR-vWA-beta-propeller ternary system domain bpX1
MDPVDVYLRIPAAYCQALGELRWSSDGEAVEFLSGGTFAFGGEIVSFLEGFSLHRTFLPFGHILHLLGILRHQRSGRADELVRLHRAFRQAGQVHRNAGVFCAVLCHALPAVPEPPSAQQLWRRVILRSFSTQPESLPRQAAAEEPPWSPPEFENHIRRALSGYDDEELVHWLKYARGTVKAPARQIAEVLDVERPRSLKGVLGQLVQHERLSGAIPFVAQLVSALALPPRRMGPPELPLGGYSDVTNRGQPEHILPSQFALDDLEFVRRYAERELLYYRREEPHARTREELVVLLDQGVRTWGVVRLVLAAALVAFGQMAERRRMPFWVATTSASGAPRDPLQMTEEGLAELLQSSDLTAHPALALERTLQDESSQVRDVVLLTHPFSLVGDLAAAARRLRPGNRLFALAVDGHGQVQLSELRQGTPLRLSQFQVDLEPKAAARPKARASPHPGGWKPWRGDVEPVGFPFRFGVESDPEPTLQFAFDHAGDWLLTASSHGMLHATRTDGSAHEVLPRGMLRGKVLRDIQRVLGVAGGFVVAGEVEGALVAFHYDWLERSCTSRVLRWKADRPEMLEPEYGRWYYDRELHSVVVVFGTRFYAFDLAQGGVFTRPEEGTRAGRALQKAQRFTMMPPYLAYGGTRPANPEEGWVNVEEDTGKVSLYLPRQGDLHFTPLVDGQPTLRKYTVARAHCCQATLALALVEDIHKIEKAAMRLCLYRVPEGVSLGEYKQPPLQWEHALSSDGRLLARQINPVQVEIRPQLQLVALTRNGDSTWSRTTTTRAGFHSGAMLQAGDYWLRLQVTPRIAHRVSWDGGELVCVVEDRGLLDSYPFAELRRLPPWVAYDPHRFQRAAWGGLIAVLDRFGQVFLFDRTGNLLCGVFAFQENLAVWTPDGVCYGSETLLPGYRPPDARERIGERLFGAWSPGKEP